MRGTAATTFLFATLLLFNGLQTLSLAVRPFSRRTFRRINRWAASTWWGMCVIGSQLMNRTRIIVTGDDLPEDENAVIVANHQDMPDIVVLMTLARSRRRLGDLKWFVKDALKHVPGIGWGMRFLECPFVTRDWTADRHTIARTFARLREERIPMWLVSFSEGTRVTAEKIAASHEYAREKGLPLLDHVLLPRTKGFVATLEGLKDHVQAVYDVTIGYVEGVPSLWQYITGQVRRVHVHVRRFPVSDLPRVGDELAAWLIRVYQEKDALLERFYSEGAFPCEPLPADPGE